MASSLSWPGCLRGSNGERERGRESIGAYSMVGLDSYSATSSVHYTPFDLSEDLHGLEQTIRHSSPILPKHSASSELYEDEDLLTQYRGSLPGTLASLPVSYSEFGTDAGALPFATSAAGNVSDLQGPHLLHPEHFVDRIDRHSGGTPPAQLKETIDAITKRNHDVAATRSKVQELRLVLRYKRDEEGQLRAALMKNLRILLLQDGGQNTKFLLQEFEKLESVAEESLELERNYQQAEDDLVQQEYVLIKSMKRLSSLLSRSPSPAIPEEHIENEDNMYDLSSVDSMEQYIPPSVVEYLSRVGDVRILQERLSDLNSEWIAISDKQNHRRQLGIALDDESQEFLDNFHETRKQIKKEMDDVLLDVGRLRAICEDQGVLTEEYTGGVDVIHELSLDYLVREAEDPLKTSALEDRSPFFEPRTPAPFSRALFINKWILHQLRHSSIEIRRFKSLPELQSLSEQGCDEMSISQMALTMWYNDDTAASAPRSSSPFDYDIEDRSDILDVKPEEGTVYYTALSRSNSLPCYGQTPRADPFHSRSVSI